MEKQTAVIGASPNPERYAYKATISLKKHGYKAYPVGIKSGDIEGEIILTDKPQLKDIHTVTMYVGPQNQHAWLDYVLSLNPQRIIFNPGTENGIIASEASKKGIECVEACTLVLLSIGQY